MNPDRDLSTINKKEVYITTNSGIEFRIINPTRDMIDIKDIAHSLSGKNRWNGHADKSFTVAEHSITMALTAQKLKYPRDIVIQSLLHDASEAYLVDMPTPLKLLMPSFIEMENNISTVIANKFNYPALMNEKTHLLDQLSLIEEGSILFKKPLRWIKKKKNDLLDTNKENIKDIIAAHEVFSNQFRYMLKLNPNRSTIKKLFLGIFDDNL